VAFQKAYLTKMGLSTTIGDQKQFGGPALMMMLGLGDKKTGDLIEQFKKKTADLKGYPIVSSSEWYVKEDPKALARKDEARAKAEADEPGPDLTGGAKNVAGNLIGSFAKKKAREHQAKKEKANEGKPVFTVYHEVKSISTAKVPADRFEVPAGYRKTK
jgi:hypothetical protein